MVFKESFGGQQERFNSYINNSYITNIVEELSNVLTIVRVKEILLSEQDEFLFNTFGEWNGLGIIKYETLDKTTQTITGYARPIDSNIKKFPLINELVYIILAPNTNLGENPYSINAYYINTIGLWNHPHHNGYPENPNALPTEQSQDYSSTQAGDVRRVSDKSTQIYLGKTFEERANIHPLLPFEGDNIIEGRWGNSIRLGSTVRNSSNNWSSIGINGDPITIIRNGQGAQSEEGWLPITENINNDDSSIYLTSNQNIPIEVARIDYTSYSGSGYEVPTSPKEYTGAQILLNSGRLVFNASSDHMLLSAGQSINLNTPESINIDTRKVLIQSDQIYLGVESLANEPLLLGNTTVNLLKNLVSSLLDLTDTLKTLTSDPVAPNSPATFTELNIKSIGISTVLQSILNELGTTPEDCKLTSKRNFTL